MSVKKENWIFLLVSAVFVYISLSISFFLCWCCAATTGSILLLLLFFCFTSTSFYTTFFLSRIFRVRELYSQANQRKKKLLCLETIWIEFHSSFDACQSIDKRFFLYFTYSMYPHSAFNWILFIFNYLIFKNFLCFIHN